MDGLLCIDPYSDRRFQGQPAFKYTHIKMLKASRLYNDIEILYLDQVVEEDSNLVKEVDTAIAAFEKSDRRNRRIPSSVIEAAIFRKPYFVNKFLSVLLKPR